MQSPWLSSKFRLEGTNDHPPRFSGCNTLSKFMVLGKLRGLEVFISMIPGNTHRLVDTGTNRVVL